MDIKTSEFIEKRNDNKQRLRTRKGITMKIYLVRHGETDANKNHIMQGQSQNLQLNENGVRQAITLKNKLKDVKFDICFTSPMIRAWSTAMILVGDRVEIKEDKRLIERYLGNLEEKDRALYDASKYWNYYLNSNDQEVEPIQDIFKRCHSFIEDIRKNYANNAVILIVSHGAVTRCLHHILKNSNLDNNLLDFKIENCYCKEYELKKGKSI